MLKWPHHLMGLLKLTYHASKTIGAEETLTTSCTSSSSNRHVLRILQVNFLRTRTTGPSRFTSRNPWRQITVLVRFQVVGLLWWCSGEKTMEVEFYFCCRAQSFHEISYWTTKSIIRKVKKVMYHNGEKHHNWKADEKGDLLASLNKNWFL